MGFSEYFAVTIVFIIFYGFFLTTRPYYVPNDGNLFQEFCHTMYCTVMSFRMYIPPFKKDCKCVGFNYINCENKTFYF